MLERTASTVLFKTNSGEKTAAAGATAALRGD
jgi:hypothetical protein